MLELRCRSWLLLFALLTLAGCDDLGLTGNVAKESEEDSATSTDQDAEEMLAKNEAAEARAWLAVEKGHSLWKGDRTAIEKLVEDLYAAGALKVYAAGITKIGANDVVAQFMAELPSEPTTRSRIFQTGAAFWKTYLVDADEEDLAGVVEKDNGQKYLMFNFDL